MTTKVAPSPIDALLRRFPGLKQFVANPIVIRDLRAQMRGSRSYWFMGGYLLLMGILAVSGYAVSTGQSLNPLTYGGDRPAFNIVDAQGKLEGFYYFIFITLSALITLIAPALTAASIVGERQRQSFDLLVTTPLTSGHILIGKLMSSIAFLSLLLVLSLPASALCILLGGATLADVFRVYFLLAVDSVILSAIGLFFSCAVPAPLLATIWTYAAVAGYFAATYVAGAMSLSGSTNNFSMPLAPGLEIAWLNPVLAVMPVMNGEGSSLALLTKMVLFLGIASLIIRLLLTASTYRLGLFGAASGPSLRKQILLLTFVTVAGTMYSAASHVTMDMMGLSETQSFTVSSTPILWVMIFPLAVATPFLPGLFVPATGADAPPGAVANAADEPSRQRRIVWNRAFHTEHSGSMPFYLLWVSTALLGAVIGASFRPGVLSFLSGILIAGGFYAICVGFLVWALSRLAGSMVTQLSSARATAFALLIAVAGLPMLVLTLGQSSWETNPLASLWILSPALATDHVGAFTESLVRSGMIAACFGVVAFVIANGISANRRRSARPQA